MTTLDRSVGAAPLYVQVMRLMKARISAGDYSPGDQLPTEHRLSASLGVSRATVIKAFDALRRQGVVDRRQGSGTFVLPPGRHALVEVTGFSAITESSGGIPTQRLLDLSRVPVGGSRDDLTATFADTVALTVLERLRYLNGQPVGHHRVAVPSQLLEDTGLRRSDMSKPDFSLYAALGWIGQKPVAATQTLRAIACPPAIAQHLQIPAGSPVMLTRRLTRNAAGGLIEAVDAIYIGSLYEYEVDLEPQNKSLIDERQVHDQEDVNPDGAGLRVAVAQRLRWDGAGQR